MILSSAQTIKAVRDILAEQVLPHLTTADWAASNLRACLLLLTYAEDCAVLERRLLADTHAAMQEFFNGALERDDLPWLDVELHGKLVAVAALLEQDGASPQVAISTLADHDLQAKAVLSEIIKRAGNARAAKNRPDDQAFRADLRTCLRVLQDADAQLTARARTMPPL
jgi:hypothetical protein